MSQTLVAVSPEELEKIVRKAVRDELLQTPPRPKNWLGAEEIALHFDVSKATVFNWVRRGCPHYDVGGLRRFELGPVDRWFRNQKEKASK